MSTEVRAHRRIVVDSCCTVMAIEVPDFAQPDPESGIPVIS
jgi:hypothetical protein